MDFVVIGLGLGALALLSGLVLLCLVAPRWSRRVPAATTPADRAYTQAIAGSRQALGQGFLCVGSLLLLATLGGISAGLDDKTGAYLIAAVTTVAALGLLGWDVLTRRRYPVPPRRRPTTASGQQDPTPVTPRSPEPLPAATPPTVTVRRRVLPARQRVVAAPGPAAVNGSAPQVEEPEVRAEPAPVTAGTESHDAAPELPDAPATVTPADAPEQSPGEAKAAADLEPVIAAETGPPDLPASAPEAPGDAGNAVAEPPVANQQIADAEMTAGPEPPASEPAPVPEPLYHADADDRVIALFPTAAARRGRPVVAPTGSNDEG